LVLVPKAKPRQYIKRRESNSLISITKDKSRQCKKSLKYFVIKENKNKKEYKKKPVEKKVLVRKVLEMIKKYLIYYLKA
jgi:hypothetical protein